MTRSSGDGTDAPLSAADRDASLEPDDLERRATAAYLLGRSAESDDLWGRAHRGFLDRGNPARAARCAFWLGFGLLERGETARGSGWMARARRLLAEGPHDCVEQGYVLLPAAIQAIGEGDAAGAHTMFTDAARIATRFRDPDLMALARHGQGRALIRLGRHAEGIALLDEAMVAVTAGEISPIAAGDVYCGVISGCQEIFDWRRAQEWTAALDRWCAARPDLVPYRGECLVRRAEIMQLHGDWNAALEEAGRACDLLSRTPGQPGVGAAHYMTAELHRLRGEFTAAEKGYRQAAEWGRKPEPGLAQLHLMQGRVEAAATAIRRVLDEAREVRRRSRLLPAGVEILLAAGDVATARIAAEELSATAAAVGAPYLRAASAQADGAVLLAQGQPEAALVPLERACALWRELDAPYEAARGRVLLASAYRMLGEEAAAAMELEPVRVTFERLGAQPDLDRLQRLGRPTSVMAAGGLTRRELQVLRLIAAGRTNRAVAAELGISEKTVARHVSNIFVKLGLSSRAAATAYACRHGLA